MKELFPEMQERRVGIFGGSFDPVHLGHLILAESALQCFGLREVLFMPCADQPLKPGLALADAASRRAMLEVAIEDNPAFRLLDLELERGGISYTVDSLRELHRTDPQSVYYFLMGADKLPELIHWHEIETVAELCRFGVFGRPDAPGAPVSALPAGIQVEHAAASRQIQISSTEIRHRVAEGLSIRYLVPSRVEMIIAERHLYQ